MADTNKRNLHFFEASTMRELYDRMRAWQEENDTRLLSVSIQNDGDMFCCIALTNPQEVVITDPSGDHAYVSPSSHALRVEPYGQPYPGV